MLYAIPKNLINMNKLCFNYGKIIVKPKNLSLFTKPKNYSNNNRFMPCVNLNGSFKLFSTTSRRDLNPLILMIAKPLAKISSMFLGRGVRQWWLALPENKRQIFLSHLIRNRFKYIFCIGATSFGSASFYLSHLEKTPITNRIRFNMFTADELELVEKLGMESIIEENKENLLGAESVYTARALRVANRLFQANKQIPEVESINWRLTVIKSDVVNACAFPNGNVLIYSGLLDMISNDDELAVVLSHEMSHAEEMSNKSIIDIVSIVISGVLFALTASNYAALLLDQLSSKFLKVAFELPYSRHKESEADSVGIMLAARACFDVRYAVNFWDKMANNDSEKNKGTLEVLSTHPASEKRSKEINEILPEAIKIRKECNCPELSRFIETVKKTTAENKEKKENEEKANK